MLRCTSAVKEILLLTTVETIREDFEMLIGTKIVVPIFFADLWDCEVEGPHPICESELPSILLDSLLEKAVASSLSIFLSVSAA